MQNEVRLLRIRIFFADDKRLYTFKKRLIIPLKRIFASMGRGDGFLQKLKLTSKQKFKRQRDFNRIFLAT